MCSRPILENARMSSFLMAEYYSTVYHIFLNHSSVGGHLGRFCILAVVDNAVINTGMHLSSKSLVSFPLGIYPEVQLLVDLFLTFEESIIFHCNNNTLYYYSGWVHLYSHQQCTTAPLFFIPSPTFISCLLDNKATLTSGRWHLIVALCAFSWWLMLLSVSSRTDEDIFDSSVDKVAKCPLDVYPQWICN